MKISARLYSHRPAIIPVFPPSLLFFMSLRPSAVQRTNLEVAGFDRVAAECFELRLGADAHPVSYRRIDRDSALGNCRTPCCVPLQRSDKLQFRYRDLRFAVALWDGPGQCGDDGQYHRAGGVDGEQRANFGTVIEADAALLRTVEQQQRPGCRDGDDVTQPAQIYAMLGCVPSLLLGPGALLDEVATCAGCSRTWTSTGLLSSGTTSSSPRVEVTTLARSGLTSSATCGSIFS